MAHPELNNQEGPRLPSDLIEGVVGLHRWFAQESWLASQACAPTRNRLAMDEEQQVAAKGSNRRRNRISPWLGDQAAPKPHSDRVRA
jgi:hypothetical protein